MARPSRRARPTAPTVDRRRALRRRLAAPLPLSFTLDADHEAHEPPEATGVRRDDVRLLVSAGLAEPVPHHVRRAPRSPPAGRSRRRQHVGDRRRGARRRHRRTTATPSSTSPPSCPASCGWSNRGARSPTGRPNDCASTTNRSTVQLPGGEPLLHLLRPAPDSERIWLAVAAAGVDLVATMAAAGRPIRYPYVPRDWPLDALPDRVRHRAGQRRDAERGPPVHRRGSSPGS